MHHGKNKIMNCLKAWVKNFLMLLCCATSFFLLILGPIHKSHFKVISRRSRNKFSISLMRMNERKECPSIFHPHMCVFVVFTTPQYCVYDNSTFENFIKRGRETCPFRIFRGDNEQRPKADEFCFPAHSKMVNSANKE